MQHGPVGHRFAAVDSFEMAVAVLKDWGVVRGVTVQ